MSRSVFNPSVAVRARLLGAYAGEVRRRAGYRAAIRSAAALATFPALRRRARLGTDLAGPIVDGVVGSVASYRAIVPLLGPHRALGAVRSAVLAAARELAATLPPLRGATDPLDALADALEATLCAGQEIGVYEIRWHDGPPGTVQLEVLRCRIHEICHALGAPEITACFCEAEVPVLTRADRHLALVRDSTIARGGALCRFTFHVIEDLDARRERKGSSQQSAIGMRNDSSKPTADC